MFLSLLAYELRQGLTKPAHWVYFLLCLGFGLALTIAITSGFPFFRIQFVGEGFFANSFENINRFASASAFFGIFMVANVMAHYMNKDFAYNAHPMTFPSGVSKVVYTASRFVSAIVISCLIITGGTLGAWVGTLMPFIEPSYFEPQSIQSYLLPLVFRTLPNVLFVGSVFFALTLIFRSQLANWVAIIILYLMTISAFRFTGDVSWSWLSPFLEPFGIIDSLAGRGITPTGYEWNNRVVWSRSYWAACTILFCLAGYLIFELSHEGRRISFHVFKFRKTKDNETAPIISTLTDGFVGFSANTPAIPRFFLGYWRIWLSMLGFEMKRILKSRYFLLITCAGFIFLYIASLAIGRVFETTTYPVTYQILGLFSGTFSLFYFVIIALFCGEMLWRDRDASIDQIIGTMPVPNKALLTAKFLAIIGVLGLLTSGLMVFGIAIQTVRGFQDYDLSQYVITLFGTQFIDLVFACALSFLVFASVRDKLHGYAIMAIWYIFSTFIAGLVLRHNLLIFGGAPNLVYSDMNGFGPNVGPFLVFKSFWGLVALGLTWAAFTLWPRSGAEPVHIRNTLSQSFKNNPKMAIAYASVLVTLGGYIFYNTNILNRFETPQAGEARAVAYEQTYKAFEERPQPVVHAINLTTDLYPNEGAASGTIEMGLRNAREAPITEFLISYDKDILSEPIFSRPVDLIKTDPEFNLAHYAFTTPLAPQEELTVRFTYDDRQNGFSNGGRSFSIVSNGTFTRPPIPRFGYQNGSELADNRLRKSYGLPERPRFTPRDAEHANATSFLGLESSFIDLDITISTSGDQTAFAPGDLVNQWQQDGRAFFRYVAREPVLNFVSVLSGEYETATRTWQPDAGQTNQQAVDISVHYDAKHGYNIERMLDAAEMSLAFFTQTYGAYPNRQLRIMEFPRYRSFAQSFPANIPFSEGIGFIADVRDVDGETTPLAELSVDYPFFVTAHEVAHQWWAHQLVAADAEGGIFLVEALSQYAAARIYEQRYGKKGLRKLLQQYARRYIAARGGTGSASVERPLLRALGDQNYIYYDKSIGTLYGVSQAIGVDLFDAALVDLLDQFGKQNGPYPTTLDFLATLKAYADPKHFSYIDDQLERVLITRTTPGHASYQRTENLEYIVDLSVEVERIETDLEGNEAKLNTPITIDIGFYNGRGQEVYLEAHILKPGENNLQLTLPRKPSTVEFDPYYKLSSDEILRPTINVAPKSAQRT